MAAFDLTKLCLDSNFNLTMSEQSYSMTMVGPNGLRARVAKAEG